MWVCKYFIIFVEFSLIGWLWESVYCAYAHKKWCNRGFLFGPLCPIYGVACILGVGLLEYLELNNIPMLKWWQIFLLSMVVSAVLEYVISYALERLFNARWWDYSDVPFNLNGRISLPTAAGFGVGGLVVMYYIAPYSISVMSSMNGVIAEFAALAIMALFGSDITLTINSLTDFLKEIDELDEAFHTHMTEVVDGIYERRAERSKGTLRRVRRFSLPRKSKRRNFEFDKNNWDEFSIMLRERLNNPKGRF